MCTILLTEEYMSELSYWRMLDFFQSDSMRKSKLIKKHFQFRVNMQSQTALS